MYVTVVATDAGVTDLFIDAGKEGSETSGMMRAWCQLFSDALQRGVPLRELVDRFRCWSFGPQGSVTNVPEIPFAASSLDLVARWLELKFLSKSTCNTDSTMP